MKRVLLIAFHFPPLIGGSGIQRTLRFVSHLPENGWQPVVLTAHPRAYDRCSPALLQEVPPGTPVIRAPAWNARKHLSLAGHYPRFLARPDRWCSWFAGAVPAALLAVRRYEPSVIWATYPIPTALRIGVVTSKLSKTPLVADFRDPMAQEGYPADPVTWRSYAKIERAAVEAAKRSVFTTPGALAAYKERYPQLRERFRLIENGYDENTFASVGATSTPLNAGHLTLLHSGVVYPDERDPRHLFAALSQLKSNDPEAYERILIRFRAPGCDDLLWTLAERHDVTRAIEVLPPIEYAEAINELCRADGILVLQANNCNAQVPAKYYEGLRAGRPLLILADPDGDTATAAREAGLGAIAALEDSFGIAAVLARFVADPNLGTLPTRTAVEAASRRQRTTELAKLFNELT